MQATNLQEATEDPLPITESQCLILRSQREGALEALAEYGYSTMRPRP